MKAIIIIEIDEDALINSIPKETEADWIVNIEEAVKQEMGWTSCSGIICQEVILSDDPMLDNPADQVWQEIKSKLR